MQFDKLITDKLIAI